MLRRRGSVIRSELGQPNFVLTSLMAALRNTSKVQEFTRQRVDGAGLAVGVGQHEREARKRGERRVAGERRGKGRDEPLRTGETTASSLQCFSPLAE